VVVDYGVTGGVLLVVSEMYEHWFLGVQHEISVLRISNASRFGSHQV
jgi:hypothetical protein